MNAIQSLRGLFGLTDYKNQQSVGFGPDQTTPNHSQITQAISLGEGVIYRATMYQSGTNTVINQTNTTALNPLGLTVAYTAYATPGTNVMTLSGFTSAAITSQFTFDVTKLRVRAMSHTANKIVGSVGLSYNAETGVLTITFMNYATTGFTTALVGAVTMEWSFELIHD